MKSKALDNFAKQINKFSKMQNIGNKVVDEIANRGVMVAQSEYSGSRAVVEKEKTDESGKMKIVSKGKGLAFEEFGTGLVGKGTYDGNLPKETIEFESPKGVPQKTEGWEYYYPNPQTKVNGGWFAGKVFHKGQIAKAQMFNTSQQLRQEMKSIAKNTIKEMIGDGK